MKGKFCPLINKACPGQNGCALAMNDTFCSIKSIAINVATLAKLFADGEIKGKALRALIETNKISVETYKISGGIFKEIQKLNELMGEAVPDGE